MAAEPPRRAREHRAEKLAGQLRGSIGGARHLEQAIGAVANRLARLRGVARDDHAVRETSTAGVEGIANLFGLRSRPIWWPNVAVAEQRRVRCGRSAGMTAGPQR